MLIPGLMMPLQKMQVRLGMEEGIVGLSDLTLNCVPGSKDAVDKAVGLFESHRFDVFYGPIFDAAVDSI